jgi:predicted HAD superfamily Cof-like phosphohydrolase
MSIKRKNEDLDFNQIFQFERLKEEIDTVKQEIAENYVPFISEAEEFNDTFGKPNNYTPTIPKEEWQSKFVYDFINEENEELREAYEAKDIVGVLDAICDIVYVGLGNAALLFGLKNKILPAYAEVQRSNMSKVCLSQWEAEKTVEVRSKEQGQPCHFEQKGDYFIVYRSSDMKVMKSINYSKPNLKQFFTEEELNNLIK